MSTRFYISACALTAFVTLLTLCYMAGRIDMQQGISAHDGEWKRQYGVIA